MGRKCWSKHFCRAAVSLSKGTPRSTVALLIHAMVTGPPCPAWAAWIVFMEHSVYLLDWAHFLSVPEQRFISGAQAPFVQEIAGWFNKYSGLLGRLRT